MGKIYCPECGTKVDGSATFCHSCGTKLDFHDENVNVYCENCGEKLTNGVCTNCTVSSSNSSISLYVIFIGYILANFSGWPLIGIVGMIFGAYLIYKGHKDLLKRRLNKTNVNGIVICVLSIIGYLMGGTSYLFVPIIIFIVVNVAFKTDQNEYYDLNGKTKYGLLILGIFLALLLVLSISSSISHEIYDSNVRNYMNDTSYLDEGYYETTINGVIFHIPNSYKQTGTDGDSYSKIVRFDGNNGDSFTIQVSNGGLPNHGKVQGSAPKTYNGVNGEMTMYKTETVKGKVTSTGVFFAYKMNGKSVEINVSNCRHGLLDVIVVK